MIQRIYRGNYLGGRFVPVADPIGSLPSRNPGNLEEAPVDFPFANQPVDEAVQSAKRAFGIWKRLPPQERFIAVQKYREVLARRGEELAFLDSFEIGKPLWEARQEVSDCLNLMDHFLQQGSHTSLLTQVPDAKNGIAGTVRHFPIGVLAVVSQSVMPLVSAHQYFIPALLNGNSVILKTTKYAPALGQAIAECIHEAGFPAGAFNFLQGDGEIAKRLTGHSGIDGVLFTGTPETSIAIKKQLLDDYWKVLVIQSGGKNATVVWEDCDVSETLKSLALSALSSAGQRYTNTSRIIVHEKLFDKILHEFHQMCKKCPIGYSLSENGKSLFMGPLVSERALEDYLRYQGIAVREGCDEIMKGKPLERKPQGYYVSPSIYSVPDPDSKSVFQTAEFFGPLVSFYKVSDIEQALEITNQTQFGLVASFFSKDRKLFERFLEGARVGLCHWNVPTTYSSYKLPVMGLKRSGNMRPMGSYSAFQCTYPLSSLTRQQDAESQLHFPEPLLTFCHG